MPIRVQQIGETLFEEIESELIHFIDRQGVPGERVSEVVAEERKHFFAAYRKATSGDKLLRRSEARAFVYSYIEDFRTERLRNIR